MSRGSDFFEFGAEWVGADFHLHTRADKKFEYAKGGNDFQSDYISALKNAGIRVGVITNHNKFDIEGFRSLREKARKEGIYLIPGLELSVSDGANGLHLLIAFSEDWISGNHNFIQQYLDKMFFGISPEQYENCKAKIQTGAVEAIKALRELNKDFFVIFAHVDQDSGLFVEKSFGDAVKIVEKISDLGCLVGFQKLTDRTRSKLEQHRHPIPVCVEGSDPDCLEKIGNTDRRCWIKIGDFSFNAVKLALTEFKTRVSLTHPAKRPHAWIRKIIFDGGGLLGRTEIDLSPELNSLIGIRGSGKSSILECLNYGLDLPVNPRRNDDAYKRNMIEYALGSGGQITLEIIDSTSEKHVVKRTYNRTTEVYDGSGNLRPNLRGAGVFEHSPLYFGQKELASDAETLGPEIVEKVIGCKLSEVRARIATAREMVIDDVSSLYKLSKISEEKKNLEEKIAAQKLQLNKFSISNVPERLDEQICFNDDARRFAELKGKYEKALNRIQRSYDELSESEFEIALSKYNKKFEVQLNALGEKLKSIICGILPIVKELEGLLSEFVSIQSHFELEKDVREKEFDKIKRELESDIRQNELNEIIKIDDYPRLKDELARNEVRMHTITSMDSIQADVKTKLLSHLGTLAELWRNEYQQISSELERINHNQNTVSIIPSFEGRKDVFLDFMKSTFRGTGVTTRDYERIVGRFVDFIEMFRNMDECLNLITNERGRNEFNRVFNENLANLLTYQVPNSYRIEYKGRDIRTLSLGQRASAMILFILGQEDNDVVIIDQPEDDLDNQTIYEDVIKTIIDKKPGIQFIFATHNANIPVLGDSEMVHCCSITRDDKGVARVEAVSGSLDIPVIREKIISVMEGGRDAFERRSEIYGLWK